MIDNVIFEPAAKKLEKIFCDSDSFYEVPYYQRPYSWETEQIEELWDDVYSAMKDGEKSYFLGSMILIKHDGYYEVVDGQQRLVTLTVLFCVLKNLYNTELSNDKELYNTLLEAIQSHIKGKSRVRLITQANQRNEFEQEILTNIKKLEFSKKDIQQSKLKNAYYVFQKKLEEIRKEDIIKLLQYFFKKVESITITCIEQPDAIRLFQVLNTRGLDLDPSDLIKSYLLRKLTNDKKEQNKEEDKESYNGTVNWNEAKEIEQFNNTWNNIQNKASKDLDESLTNLFTYYAYYLLNKNPKRSLYEELVDQFKKDNTNKIIFDFSGFVDYFKEVSSEQNKTIYSFYYLPNQFFWKAILTTAKKENFEPFDELCKELRKLYYCYWIAGYTTSKIKQLSFDIIKWIKDKIDLTDIKNMIENKLKNDNVIQLMLVNLENDVYSELWLKPLLLLIEYNQTDDSIIEFIELNKKLNIDHILPKEWKSEEGWGKSNWIDSEAKELLNKIGNLTLLSESKNKSQHNAPPLIKAEKYQTGHGKTTAFKISQKVIEELKKGKWNKDDVKNRTEWIMKQIEELFSIKLASKNDKINAEKIKEELINQYGG